MASEQFLGGGMMPLSSLRGLPSYDDAVGAEELNVVFIQW